MVICCCWQWRYPLQSNANLCFRASKHHMWSLYTLHFTRYTRARTCNKSDRLSFKGPATPTGADFCENQRVLQVSFSTKFGQLQLVYALAKRNFFSSLRASLSSCTDNVRHEVSTNSSCTEHDA